MMALFKNGPHTVDIYYEEETTDFRGNPTKRPSETVKVTVSGCFMQPVASARGAFAALKVKDGQDVLVAYKLMFDATLWPQVPLGWWSRVVWTDEDGNTRKFSCLGGPQVRYFTAMTKHVSCTLQEER